MKYILSLLCIFAILLCAGCATQSYDITYDDATLFKLPVSSAKAGDVVQLRLDKREGVSFYIHVNDITLSPHDFDENDIIYEFIMPQHDVHITYTKEELPMNNNIRIPSAMTRHHIDYSTEYKFNGPYMMVGTIAEAEALFAGFAFRQEDIPKPYATNFFDNFVLVAFVQHEGSGSVGHSLKCVELLENELTITIYREVPALGTCDMASYLCLVSIPRNILPQVLSTRVNVIDKEM